MSTFYALDQATFLTSLTGFFNAISGVLPTDVHVQVESSGDIIEDTTGALVDAWSGPAQDMVNGTNNAAYAAPTGGVVTWLTATVLDLHRVRGRTFIVPIASEKFTAAGGLSGACVSLLKDAADALIADQSETFVVWHRPFAGAPAAGGRPARPAHLGGNALVTASRVPSMAVVLRSRRD